MRVKIKKESQEVFYCRGDLISINSKVIKKLISQSNKSKFKKSRYCFHKNKQSKLQEMIICHKKNYYVRPHKHLNKEESIYVIKGRADAYFFDNKGNIVKILELGNVRSNKNFYYKLNKKLFHTLVIKSKYFIFHEVSDGPFIKNRTIFAKWAPEKNYSTFMHLLKTKIKKYKYDL